MIHIKKIEYKNMLIYFYIINMENTNDSCAICLNNKLNLPITLNCGHIFCYLCIKCVKLNDVQLATCPLCRAKLDNKIIESLKLENNNIVNNQNIIWLYEGRKNGWWEYDEETNIEIENLYQKFKYIDEISDKSDEIKLNNDIKYNITIGNMNFEIDFENMYQINKYNYTRQIYRYDRINNYDNSIEKCIKGIAGLSKKI